MNVYRLLLIPIVAATFASCGALKPSANYYTKQNLTNTKYTKEEAPQFLEINSTSLAKSTHTKKESIVTLPTQISTPQATAITTETLKETVNAEAFVMAQLKYAIILDVAVETITNLGLYTAIDNWYGTRYRFGGTSKGGIDCSALMQKIYEYAFNKKIPRTAVTQYRESTRIVKEELQEGDLIFFHTTRPGISHVGLYLGNSRFVHASSSHGVTINNLNETYYKNGYRGCGRFAADYECKE